MHRIFLYFELYLYNLFIFKNAHLIHLCILRWAVVPTIKLLQEKLNYNIFNINLMSFLIFQFINSILYFKNMIYNKKKLDDTQIKSHLFHRKLHKNYNFLKNRKYINYLVDH